MMKTPGSVELLSAGGLCRLRRRLKLSQEEMASLIGVSYVTVSRWENGHFNPSRLARERIAAVMQHADDHC